MQKGNLHESSPRPMGLYLCIVAVHSRDNLYGSTVAKDVS